MQTIPLRFLSRYRSLRLVGAFIFAASVSVAAPILRVGFVPELKNGLGALPGFETMLIPISVEQNLTPPINQTFYGFIVTVSAQALNPGGKINEKNGRLVTRIRSLSHEQQLYPYYELLRCWVGSQEGFSLQIEGMKAAKQYKVTFYAYDYGTVESPRIGQNVIQDVLNSTNKPLIMSWDTTKDVLNSKSPLNQKAASLVSTAGPDGRLLFSISPGPNKGTALINAFEIEEVR